MPRKPTDPLAALRREAAKGTRIALEDLFWWWLRHQAPVHFQRLAFSKHPSAYAESAKRNREQWLKRHAVQIQKHLADRNANPLRASGKLERAFLRGSVTFTGSNTRLRARWPNLPRYADMRNRYSGFHVGQALVTVSPDELKQLERQFAEFLRTKWINREKLRNRSYGRIVFTIA